MFESDSLYRLRDEADIPSPALVYYEELLGQNLALTLRIAGGPERLWPHVKTHKMDNVVRMQLAAGIERFKCATIAEADMVASCGAPHVLLAYPLIGPNVRRFLGLMRKYPDTHFYALGDDYIALESLSRAALAGGAMVSTLLDIDLGMHRTGISAELAPELYRACAPLAGLDMAGLHCYDGHVHESKLEERAATVAAITAQVKQLIGTLHADGFPCPNVIMGGTPSFPCHALTKGVYLSPGTIFVSDSGYRSKYPDIGAIPAAAILTRVISRTTPHTFTIDLGYKAIAAESNPPGVIAGMPQAKPLFQSEEHWVFELPADIEPPPVGSVLYVIPRHVCPTTALYPEALVARAGSLAEHWQVTARNH